MAQYRPLSETKFINDANLVAYYPLENTTDIKGGFNLTNNNSVTFSAAKFNNGADSGTNNTNKNLSINNTLGITNNTNRTLSCWVKMNTELSGADSFGDFISMSYSDIDIDFRFGYWRESNVNKLAFDRGKFAVGTTQVKYNIDLGTTNWYHLAMTWDGTNIAGYLNGKNIGSAAFSGNGNNGYNDLFTILSDSNNANFISAIVDDTAVFSRALSSAEVNELYQGMTLGEYLGAGAATTKLLLHLNGNSTDSSGNGNNGTDTNITYSLANGKFGQGAGFNGSSSKITTTFNPLYTSATWSCWVKKTGTTRGQFMGHVGNSGEIIIFEFNTATITFRYGLSVTRELTTTGSFNDGAWHNVIGTRTGATTTLYVDGFAVPTNLTSSGTIGDMTCGDPFVIGCRNDTPRFFYDGKVDEVIIENRAWTASEVKKYYTYAKGRFN